MGAQGRHEPAGLLVEPAARLIDATVAGLLDGTRRLPRDQEVFRLAQGRGVDEAAEIIKEMADPEANIIFGTVIDERMGDDLQITVIATGFDAARKGGLYAGAAAQESLQAGLENRDYMQELQRQRTAAGEREEAEGNGETEPREAVAVPISTGTPVAAGEGRATKEAEDLDIPAFLRRSR